MKLTAPRRLVFLSCGCLMALVGGACQRPSTYLPDGGDAGDGVDGGDRVTDADGGAECPEGFAAPLDESGFLLRLDGSDLYVEAFLGAGVRLTFRPRGAGPKARASWATREGLLAGEASLRYSADCQEVEIDDRTVILRVRRSGELSAFQHDAGGEQREFFRTPAGASLEAGGRVSLELLAAGDEHIYGLGEKTGPLDRRGRKLVFRNTDPLAGGDYTTESDPLYQSIPIFFGLRDGWAYGVFVDNTYRMEFDLGQGDPGRYLLAADGGDMDVYLLAGPDLSAVLDGYAGLCGAPELFPRWALGYHQSRWSYAPAERVLEVAREFRRRSIPADGIWLDIDYLDGFRSFTWDPVGFPDPAGLVGELESLGFKATAIIDPGLKTDPAWDIYQQGLSGGHFLRRPDGTVFIGEVWPGPAAFPDFSSPAARAWWASLVPRVLSAGVRGLWIDMNEPASFKAEDGHSVPDEILADGDGIPTTMAEVHNVYALLMARATREGMLSAAPWRRPFLLSRSGFAGIQRYSAVWTGDAPSSWPMLRQQLPVMLGLSLSGVWFVGSDVGGFSGGATPELFARWLELGAISPFFRGHVQTGAPDQEPWAFGVEVEDIARSVIGLRYRMLPYLYSLSAWPSQDRHAHEPMLAPLLYWFQGDPDTYRLDDQAMLGPWLMAAPVLEAGAAARSVYFPGGRWFELHSGRLFEGPSRQNVNVTLAALPLFVRAGAILPLGPEMQWSDEKPLDPLEFALYPEGAPSLFYFYEDDGKTLAYREGVYSVRSYRLQRTPTGALFRGKKREGTFSPPARKIKAVFRPVDGEVTQVLLDGVALPARAGLEELSASGLGWWFDPEDLSLMVLFDDRPDFEMEAFYQSSDTTPVTVNMLFSVAVPANTPPGDTIYLGLSSSGWQQVPLGPIVNGLASGRVGVPRGEWFEYKYTRGDWSTVEKWNGCAEAKNRYALGAAHPTKEDRVEAWADLCP